MASFEDLQKQAEQKAIAKADLAKQAELKAQEAIDKKFNRKKSQEEMLNYFENDNKKEIESLNKKRTSSIISFRSAVDNLKKQFEDAKNNPDSIFAPFFEKDKDGNVKNKIDYKKVLDKENGIDEFINQDNEYQTIKPKARQLKRNKGKIESAIHKNKKVQEDLYPNTSKYKKEQKEKQEKELSDKYIKKGNYVSDLFWDMRDNLNKGYFVSPYDRVDTLVSKDKDKIDDVRKLIDKKIEEGIDQEEKELELDKVKTALDKIEKFQKERVDVSRDLHDMENKAIDFTNKLYDIKEVSQYYGGRDNMEADFLNHEFSSNFNIIKNFLQNYSNNEKRVLDLESIKKCIQDQMDYMDKFLELKDKDPQKIKEYFTNDKKDELYKEIVGEDKPRAYTRNNPFYPYEPYFGKRVNEKDTLSEIKNQYNIEIQKLNKKKEIIKGYALSSFDHSVQIYKIKEANPNNNISDLEYILKKDKETKSDLSNYLKWTIEDLEKKYKNKLEETIVFSSSPMMFESDKKEIDNLKVFIQNAKDAISVKDKEIISLKSKDLGFFDNKTKHKILIADKEKELKDLKQDLENKKADLRNKEAEIEKSDNNQIIQSIFRDSNSIYNNFTERDFYNLKTPLTLAETLNKFKEIINGKLLEMENKEESNEKLEKELKKYHTLDKVFTENKDNLIKFYKENVKDKK